MSYFTETFYSILEFKDSADPRDTRDKLSGDHKWGKATSHDIKRNPGQYSPNARNMNDKRASDNLHKAVKDANNTSRRDFVRGMNHIDKSLGREVHRQATKESSSWFDGYDYL